jgi:hypothetical protein
MKPWFLIKVESWRPNYLDIRSTGHCSPEAKQTKDALVLAILSVVIPNLRPNVGGSFVVFVMVKLLNRQVDDRMEGPDQSHDVCRLTSI